MSRTHLPYHAEDISALARTLKGELARLDHQPGHVELLNILARGAGWRNFQHFRAQDAARAALEQPTEPAPPPDYLRVRRTLRHFDDKGRMVRWPGKHTERQLCLWVLWSRLPARHTMTEKQVNEALAAQHLFGDHALLRRELVDGGWLKRTRDGAVYQRQERRPSADALALIAALP
ncbi:DUF2087 domain-containing protein [Magnetospirillum aberrantis]|uniref:DUF2087 domain-containing protein n=1 Tax=Magnetospirillum aberrantis SpK TaxID=908842 RepID=A0A7C9QTL9_9PROT|nr:DUF2087 domain-containing protein [Magnetospirillum aberrantis]NFV80202.1 DUF2087 domain-containing protein [Magnetospirillum aberrantis SpK]